MNFRKYRGYIGARLLFGRSVPQHIQQLVIRDYCQRHGLKFLLSATEYVMPGSTMMLDAALQEDTEGIVFYSMALLPVDEEKRRRLWASGKDIHFAAENIHGFVENLFKTTLFVSDYHAGDQFPRTITYLDQARLSGACNG
jgi:sporadic carbohydrate cluster protein (TIGR04323 family)